MLRFLFLYVIQCENKNTIFSFIKLNNLNVYTHHNHRRRRRRCSEILPRISPMKRGNSIYALLSFTYYIHIILDVDLK